jgi:hypothetical protein
LRWRSVRCWSECDGWVTFSHREGLGKELAPPRSGRGRNSEDDGGDRLPAWASRTAAVDGAILHAGANRLENHRAHARSTRFFDARNLGPVGRTHRFVDRLCLFLCRLTFFLSCAVMAVPSSREHRVTAKAPVCDRALPTAANSIFGCATTPSWQPIIATLSFSPFRVLGLPPFGPPTHAAQLLLANAVLRGVLWESGPSLLFIFEGGSRV